MARRASLSGLRFASLGRGSIGGCSVGCTNGHIGSAMRVHRRRLHAASSKPAAAASLARPFLFASSVSVGAFTIAEVVNQERRRWWRERKRKRDRSGGILEIIQRFAIRNPETMAAAPLVALNGLVFLAWRLNPGSAFMMRNFLNSPSTTNRSLPMLLSTFSHVSLPHLGFNMYALWSFGTLMVSYMGPETSGYVHHRRSILIVW